MTQIIIPDWFLIMAAIWLGIKILSALFWLVDRAITFFLRDLPITREFHHVLKHKLQEKKRERASVRQ